MNYSGYINSLIKSKISEHKKLVIFGQNIDDLLNNIQTFKDYEKTGYYENTQGMNTGDHAYYMEVTAVEDSIVIAKIIGSKNAVYRVRKGDWIYITK